MPNGLTARLLRRYPVDRAKFFTDYALPGRAQYFPERASFRISLSNVSSDTALFSRSFSRSSSFSRLA